MALRPLTLPEHASSTTSGAVDCKAGLGGADLLGLSFDGNVGGGGGVVFGGNFGLEGGGDTTLGVVLGFAEAGGRGGLDPDALGARGGREVGFKL